MWWKCLIRKAGACIEVIIAYIFFVSLEDYKFVRNRKKNKNKYHQRLFVTTRCCFSLLILLRMSFETILSLRGPVYWIYIDLNVCEIIVDCHYHLMQYESRYVGWVAVYVSLKSISFLCWLRKFVISDDFLNHWVCCVITGNIKRIKCVAYLHLILVSNFF